MDAMFLDTTETVGAALLGAKLSNKLFLGTKRLRLSLLSMVLWTIALVIGFLASSGVLPKGAVWLSAMGFPVSVLRILFSNKFLLRRLAFSLEVWYLVGLTTLWAVATADIMRYDERMIFLAVVWTSIVNVILCDAAHPSSAKYNPFGIVIGILLEGLMIVFWHLDMIPDTNRRTFDVSLGPSGTASLKLDIAMFATQRLLIVLLFFCKNLYLAVRRPGCFVVLRASVKAEKMQVKALKEMLKWRQEHSTVRSMKHLGESKVRSSQTAPASLPPAVVAPAGPLLVDQLKQTAKVQAGRIQAQAAQIRALNAENEALKQQQLRAASPQLSTSPSQQDVRGATPAGSGVRVDRSR